jgi:hypothetical protein
MFKRCSTIRLSDVSTNHHYKEEMKEVTEQRCRAVATAGGEAGPGRVGQER